MQQFPIRLFVAVVFLFIFALADDLTCDSPPIIEGTTQSQLQGTRHPEGTVVNYQCEFGYISHGSRRFQSVCHADEQTGTLTWSNPNVRCTPRSCSDPGFVPNADRIGDVFTFPHQVQYQCHEGFKLRGLAVRYCQANGEWSGVPPECKQIQCHKPEDPENGKVLYSTLDYGTELKYECNKGFILKEQQDRVCSADGEWSNHEPICTEGVCEIPQAPEHGSVQLLGSPKANAVALFKCNDGLTLVGSSASKCLITGQWTFDTPKCFKPCSVPPVERGSVGRFETVRISRGKFEERLVQIRSFSEIIHGERVDLLCNEGLIAGNNNNGQRSVRDIECNDGQWSNDFQCKSALCLGDALPMEHGDPVISARTHGHVIYYKCHPNYIKSKTGHVKCVYGQWTGYTPVCVEDPDYSLRCHLKDLNVDGLTKPNLEYLLNKKSFKVSCIKGYKKSGSWGDIACNSGKWTVPEDPCAEESCSNQPPSIDHGRIEVFDTKPGSEVHYECDQGFQMRSQSDVRCRLGEWTGQPPSCVSASSISIESSTTAGKSVTAGNRIGDPSIITTTNAPGETSNQEERCSCQFYNRDTSIKVEYDGKILHYGQNISKEQRVVIGCQQPSKHQVWPNGLVLSGPVNLTCNGCEKWNIDKLPFCIDLPVGAAWITYTNKLNLQPGGTIEVRKGEDFEAFCHAWNIGYPRWTADHHTFSETYTTTYSGNWVRYNTLLKMTNVQTNQAGRYICEAKDHNGQPYNAAFLDLIVPNRRCSVLDEIGTFHIQYSNSQELGSVAKYTCRDDSKDLTGSEQRTCLETGQWSSEEPKCKDVSVQCSLLDTTEDMTIDYSDGQKIGSRARYHCNDASRVLTGLETRTCLDTGSWSDAEPRCVEKKIQCPRLDGKGQLIIVYSDWKRPVDTVARITCRKADRMLRGSDELRCLPNGEWSAETPTCIDVTCPEFRSSQVLKVSYSNGIKPLSFAKFECLPPTTLVGSSSTMCRYNGTWDKSAPICEYPGCSLDDLMTTVPEGLVPDMEGVTEELLPVGTELRLLCDGNLVHIGKKQVTCGPLGKWDIGDAQCIVGCLIDITDEMSQLIIEPIKESYRFGEFVVLRCEDGHKLTTDVQKVMCIGGQWSDPVPECEKVDVIET